MNTRRTFLSATLASAATLALPVRTGARSAGARFKDDPFSLGVASGYPTDSSVILWTRLAPKPLQPDGGMSPAPVEVRWEVGEDERMSRIVRRGTARAVADWAHSVHIEVSGLEPAREYWYRFMAGDARSMTGRTRTAPAPGAPLPRLKLAVVACQHYEEGFFSGYRHMVRDDLDLIVHTGDYIYEATWPNSHVRKHPIEEARTLEDYRLLFALYRCDSDLAAAHASVPWLVTWDDHEVFNDYAGDLSDAKVAKEMFRARRLAAYRAYYEHMPLPPHAVPTDANMRLYAQRAFGDLAAIHVLDQRQYRSLQACRSSGQRRLRDCAELLDTSRTMLGDTQEAWLFDRLARSDKRWNLMVQGTVMSHIDEDAGPGTLYWADGWNGYPAARDRLMNHLVARRVSNPVVLSGDIHAFVASGLHLEAAKLDSPIVATELVTTSLTSAGMPQKLIDEWRAINPNLLVAASEHRGYLLVNLTRERLDASLVALDNVRNRETTVRSLGHVVVESQRPGPQLA